MIRHRPVDTEFMKLVSDKYMGQHPTPCQFCSSSIAFAYYRRLLSLCFNFCLFYAGMVPGNRHMIYNLDVAADGFKEWMITKKIADTLLSSLGGMKITAAMHAS